MQRDEANHRLAELEEGEICFLSLFFFSHGLSWFYSVEKGEIGVCQGKASFRHIFEGDGNVSGAQSKPIFFPLVFSASSQLLKEIDVLEIQFQIERSCRQSAEELAVKVCVVLFGVIVPFAFVLRHLSLSLLSSSFTLHSFFPVCPDDQGKQRPEEEDDASTADAAGGLGDGDLWPQRWPHWCGRWWRRRQWREGLAGSSTDCR